jgi:hypothetical protein
MEKLMLAFASSIGLLGLFLACLAFSRRRHPQHTKGEIWSLDYAPKEKISSKKYIVIGMAG